MVRTGVAAWSVPAEWWSPSSHPDDGRTSAAEYQPARTGGRCKRTIGPVSGGTFGTVGGGSTSPAPPRQGGGRGHQDECQLDRDRPEDGDQQKWVGPGAQEKLSRSDGTAGAWPSWSNARVVKTIICHGQPHQEAEAEQQHQRRLLGLADGDVHGEQADKRCDPEHDAPPAGHVPVEVDAQREQADGQRDQPTVCPRASPCRCVPRKDGKTPTCVVILCHKAAPVS